MVMSECDLDRIVLWLVGLILLLAAGCGAQATSVQLIKVPDSFS